MKNKPLKKINEGTADTFYQAIMNADNKKKERIFTFDTIAERYVLFSYFFKNSKKICIYSRDISLFSKNNLKELLNEKCGNTKDIHSLFLESLKKFLTSNDSKLQILADNITSESMNQIEDSVRDLFKNNVEIKKMNSNLNIVKGFYHFLSARDKCMVCFEQRQEKPGYQIFFIGYKGLNETTLSVFDDFFEMSDFFKETEKND